MFRIEFYKKSEKDLKKIGDEKETSIIIDNIEKELSENPFPYGKVKKKIKGMYSALYRLRVDSKKDTYRIFYLIQNDLVTVLRIVKKKDADLAMKTLR